MKHTPGPWTWDAGDIGADMSEPYCEVVKDDLLIASVNDRFDRAEGRANARLIAAAPAYHEAAEELAMLVLQSECYTNPDIRDAVNDVLAIHRRVEGETK